MNTAQSNRLQDAWDAYSSAGGSLVIEGVPIGNCDDAKSGLSAFTAQEVDVVIQHLRDLTLQLEELKKPNSYKPGDIPTRDSKPTLDVSSTRATIVNWN